MFEVVGVAVSLNSRFRKLTLVAENRQNRRKLMREVIGPILKIL